MTPDIFHVRISLKNEWIITSTREFAQRRGEEWRRKERKLRNKAALIRISCSEKFFAFFFYLREVFSSVSRNFYLGKVSEIYLNAAVGLGNRWIVILVENIDVQIGFHNVLIASIFFPYYATNSYVNVRSWTTREFQALTVQRWIRENFVVDDVKKIRPFNRNKF